MCWNKNKCACHHLTPSAKYRKQYFNQKTSFVNLISASWNLLSSPHLIQLVSLNYLLYIVSNLINLINLINCK
jgi:hypothetical protein